MDGQHRRGFELAGAQRGGQRLPCLYVLLLVLIAREPANAAHRSRCERHHASLLAALRTRRLEAVGLKLRPRRRVANGEVKLTGGPVLDELGNGDVPAAEQDQVVAGVRVVDLHAEHGPPLFELVGEPLMHEPDDPHTSAGVPQRPSQRLLRRLRRPLHLERDAFGAVFSENVGSPPVARDLGFDREPVLGKCSHQLCFEVRWWMVSPALTAHSEPGRWAK